MARQRRTNIEVFIDTYAAMDPEERALAKAALTGADRVLSRTAPTLKLTEAVRDGFAELGADIAGDAA